MKPKRPGLLLLLLLAAFLAANPVLAGPTATVTGRVTDPSGAVIAGVKVEATNVATNVTFSGETNAEGLYNIPNLPPGTYRVIVQKFAFRTIVKPDVELHVQDVIALNFSMELGSVVASITVEGGAPLANVSSATIGKVVENRRIVELPLNGRNVLALVLLTPGVKSSAGPTNSGFGDRGITLSSVSINGSPNGMNSYLLDGGNNNDGYQAGININPAVDAVEEFKVQSNTMSAEFGFTAGGVINIVTKSGTNALHGSLYEFLRNDEFDARRAFAASKAPFRYNQFGGAAGGPVYFPKLYNGRDKSFFFFNYEEWRFLQYGNTILTVPSPEQRRGDFSQLRDAAGALIPIYDPFTTRMNPAGTGFIRDLFPGNLIPSNRLDPISLNILPFYPLPNRTPSNPMTNSNNFIGNNAESRSMRQYTAKIDQRVSARNTLFGRFSYYAHFTDQGTGGVLPDPVVLHRDDNYQTRNFILSDTHASSPSLLNELRLGVTRFHLTFASRSNGGNWPTKLGLPDTVPPYTFPAISNGLPNFVTGEYGVRASTIWQFMDTVTFIRGTHTFKFGTTIRINQTNNYQRSSASGSFSFPAALTGNPQRSAGTGSGFATFLLGAVGSASVNTVAGLSHQGYSTSFFLQDDWKITRRLTLNLGLRHDYQPWAVERHNGLSNFDPFARDPSTGLLGRLEFAGRDYGRRPLANVKDNFGPRLGFACDLFGNGKTVLRGGYGIFYPVIFARDYFGDGTGFTSLSTSYLPPGGNTNFSAFQFRNGFPTRPLLPLGAALGPSGLLGQNVNFEQSREKVPLAQQWNLSLQHQFRNNWLVEGTYSGSHGTHFLSGNYDFNQLDPTFFPLGLALQNQVPNPFAGVVPGALGGSTITREQSLRPYPYYNQIAVRNPLNGNSNYHAFLLTVEKRLSRGLVLLGSYTNSKLINDSIRTMFDFGTSVEQVGEVGYQNGKYDRRAERSLDPTDVSQRFVFSGVYELPFGTGKRWRSSNRFFRSLTGGWAINSITTIQGGLPLIVRGANNFRANRPNSTGRSAKLQDRTAERWFDPTAFVNPPNFTLGNLGRVLPDVRTPGVVNVDLSAIKNTFIGERLRVEFRVEAFNVANHVNLGFPNTTFVPGADGRNQSATFGTITSSRDARILQLGLKLVY